MSDDTKKESQTFEGELGGTHRPKLKILLSKKPQPAQQEDERKKNEASRRPSPMDYFIKRKGTPVWYFFDLGTRLNVATVASTYDTGIIPLDKLENDPIDDSSVLEYLELDFDAVGLLPEKLTRTGTIPGQSDIYKLGPDHLQVDPQDWAAIDAWNGILLNNLDPFETSSYPTNHDRPKVRDIDNCMPIWYGLDGQKTRDEYTFSGGRFSEELFDILVTGDSVSLYPNARFRERARDIEASTESTGTALEISEWASMDLRDNAYWDKVKDKDGNYTNEIEAWENWNPLSLTQGSTDISYRATMLPRTEADPDNVTNAQPLASGFLSIDSIGIYEPFDCEDTSRYKITTDPSYSADAVGTLKVSPSDKLRIFLVPRWLCYWQSIGAFVRYPIDYESCRIFDSSRSRFMNATTLVGPGKTIGPTGHHIDFVVLGPDFDDPSYDVDAILPDTDGSTGGTPTTIFINTNTGAWSVTGSILSGSGSATLNDPAIPATHDTWSFHLYANGWKIDAHTFAGFPGSHSNIDQSDIWTYGTKWTTVHNSITVDTDIARGAHIGRWPLFPRTLPRNFNTHWSSTFSSGGTDPYTLYNQNYDPAVAAGFDGRFFNAEDLDAPYHRHASRDGSVNKLWRWFDIPTAEYLTTGPEVFTTSIYLDVGLDGTDAEITTVLEDYITSVGAEFTGVLNTKPFIRSVRSGGSITVNIDPVGTGSNNAIFSEIDLKTGKLLGVVEKNSKKYYIWANQDEDRGGYDMDRTGQGVAFGDFNV